MKESTRILKTEHHIHLYGCLSPEDLFEIGTENRESNIDRLDWYASEYQKAYGKRPEWKNYWDKNGGLERLKNDFLFLEREDFNKFQASFNLIIALCKVDPNDSSVVQRVFKKIKSEGIEYAEARTVLPPYIQGEDINKYFTTIADATLSLTSKNFTPRLALSIPRESPYTHKTYEHLRKWMDINPNLAEAFSAVDLAFYEENDPPKGKREFVERVLKDNNTREHKLAVLYHVGESFNTISVASSARWVWEVAQMGATRLGHAISLGIGPDELTGRTVFERVEEKKDHLNWLLVNANWLGECGYDVDKDAIEAQLLQISERDLEERIKIVYDETYLKDFQNLQNALIQNLKATVDPIIECCPTSNARIGMIQKPENHPLKRFVEADLKVCISTDDPGIFNINLREEVKLAVSQIGISDDQLKKIARSEFDYCSASLCC